MEKVPLSWIICWIHSSCHFPKFLDALQECGMTMASGMNKAQLQPSSALMEASPASVRVVNLL